MSTINLTNSPQKTIYHEIASRVRPYIRILKLRMSVMVLVVAGLGFYLASNGNMNMDILWITLLSCTLASGGSFVLNQYMEYQQDAKMHRTQNRPIPTGEIPPLVALIYGVSLVLSAVFLLFWKVNLLSSFIVLLIAFLYVLVYTPLKQITWLNTPIGAIPGALPPLVGWAAAANSLSVEAWILFGILFMWQHPHFYAIAIMYREDYARGGYKMLPVIDNNNRRAVLHIILFSLMLLPISILPSFFGMTGTIYAVGALSLGIWMLSYGVKMIRNDSVDQARKLLYNTLLYLPGVTFFALLDSILA